MGPLPTTNIKRYILGGVVGTIFLLLLITFFSSMRSIDTGKVGVVTRYGKVTGRELGEGLSWVAPWGIDNVTEYDIKKLKVDASVAAATKDLQDVTATIVLTYNLNRGEVSDTHKTVGEKYQSIEIDPQVQEAFKATTAQFTNSELITRRPEVKEEVLKNLRKRVEGTGRYTISDIALTNFQFSKAFNDAIEAVQVANQKVAQAEQELRTTKVEAEKSIAEAQAKAEAQRLQQQTLTPEILQQEAIKKWDGKLPVYSTNGSTLFNLPIKQ